MLDVLVTGFGPFPGVSRNPTGTVVQRLQQRPANGLWNLHAHVLATEYASASIRIATLLRSIEPDVCICFGVASPGPIRLERVARNETTAAGPDNAGDLRFGTIEPQGSPFYLSTLPLDAIAETLRLAGYAVELSDDAGGYVCNHIFYVARHVVETFAPSISCGFVHFPPITDASTSLDRLVTAAEIVIETAVRQRLR
jgi:pyroglutamyl-peptidase